MDRTNLECNDQNKTVNTKKEEHEQNVPVEWTYSAQHAALLTPLPMLFGSLL